MITLIPTKGQTELFIYCLFAKLRICNRPQRYSWYSIPIVKKEITGGVGKTKVCYLWE